MSGQVGAWTVSELTALVSRAPVRGKTFEPDTTLVYARSSSPGEFNPTQVDSVEQQETEIITYHGKPIPERFSKFNLPTRYFDRISGMNTSRPKFDEIVALCLANPQPSSSRCKILVYSVGRFGRPVLKDEMVAEHRITEAQRSILWSHGWDVKFVHTAGKTGVPLVDNLLINMESEQAAKENIQKSTDVSRGKQMWAEKGRWVGARAPFGTHRWCMARKCILHDTDGSKVEIETRDGTRLVTKRGDYGMPNSTILCRNERELEIWKKACAHVLAGWSLNKLGEWLHTQQIETGRGGTYWNTDTVKQMLLNKALIGINHYRGRRGEAEYDGAWGCLLNAEERALYDKVQAKVSLRERGNRAVDNTDTVLSGYLYCAHCGLPWWGHHARGGTIFDKKRGREKQYLERRYYQHVTVKGRRAVHDTALQLAAKMGCQEWIVDASVVENAVIKELAARRTGPSFAVAMKALFDAATTTTEGAENEVAEAEELLHKLRKRHANRMEMAADEDDREERKKLHDQAKKIREEIKKAEAALRELKLNLDATSSATQYQSVEELLNETDLLLEAAERMDLDSRARVLRWWVVRIDVVHAPGLGKAHGKPFGLHIWLRNFPAEPASVICQNINGRQATQERRIEIAAEAEVPVADVCAWCLTVGCNGSCGDTRKINAVGGRSRKNKINSIESPSTRYFNIVYLERVTIEVVNPTRERRYLGGAKRGPKPGFKRTPKIPPILAARQLEDPLADCG